MKLAFTQVFVARPAQVALGLAILSLASGSIQTVSAASSATTKTSQPAAKKATKTAPAARTAKTSAPSSATKKVTSPAATKATGTPKTAAPATAATAATPPQPTPTLTDKLLSAPGQLLSKSGNVISKSGNAIAGTAKKLKFWGDNDEAAAPSAPTTSPAAPAPLARTRQEGKPAVAAATKTTTSAPKMAARQATPPQPTQPEAPKAKGNALTRWIPFIGDKEEAQPAEAPKVAQRNAPTAPQKRPAAGPESPKTFGPSIAEAKQQDRSPKPGTGGMAPPQESSGFFGSLMSKITGNTSQSSPAAAATSPTRKNPGAAGAYVPEAYLEKPEDVFVVSRDSTPFYLRAPQANTPPDEILSTGHVLLVQKRSWGWAEVKLKDGRVGLVDKGALRAASTQDVLAYLPKRTPQKSSPGTSSGGASLASSGSVPSLIPEASLPQQSSAAIGSKPATDSTLLPLLPMAQLPEPPPLDPLPPSSAGSSPDLPSTPTDTTTPPPSEPSLLPTPMPLITPTPAPTPEETKSSESVKADNEALSNSLLPPSDRQ